MKKFFKRLALVLPLLGLSLPAMADYTLIVPQKPGGGTSVWATIIGRELEKKLGEPIIVQHIPGAKDIPGANKFQKELRFDPKTIMVSHGGNAESYLYDKVEYTYKDWAPIGAMNLDIIVGRHTDLDLSSGVKFAAGSGMNPDVMAITLLVCGPLADIPAYVECFNKNITYVTNMDGGERRMAYQRGELNVTRDTTSAYKKYVEPLKDFNTTWFAHGVLDLETGQIAADPNYPDATFSDVYKAKWGEAPSGDLYDAYVLVKNYRDVLQKALWVDKDNPNIEKLRAALTEMLADPESVKAIQADAGNYEWFVGEDVNKALAVLEKQTTEKNLRNLVSFVQSALKNEAVYKEHLVQQ